MYTRATSRKKMNAAINAMKELGFPETLTRVQVEKLLKVYGGNDGWIFIEDKAYQVLHTVCSEANTNVGSSLQEEDTTLSKNEGGANVEGEGVAKADETEERALTHPAWIRCPRPVNTDPNYRPCFKHGWLCSDSEDEDDFILMLPLPPGFPLPPGVTLPPGMTHDGDKTKYKSPWK